MNNLIRAVLVFVSVVVVASAVCAEPMTVEQAYATMAHPHLVFNPQVCPAPQDESRYLAQLFQLIDLAVKERVETLTWIQSRGTQGDGKDEYDALVSQLHALNPPTKLQSVHALTVAAIEEQRTVLREWRGHPENVSMQHPLVRSSSQKLYQAYGEVPPLSPADHRANQAAFYNYFCCLDFL